MADEDGRSVEGGPQFRRLVVDWFEQYPFGGILFVHASGESHGVYSVQEAADYLAALDGDDRIVNVVRTRTRWAARPDDLTREQRDLDIAAAKPTRRRALRAVASARTLVSVQTTQNKPAR